jgi:hypothetical protein
LMLKIRVLGRTLAMPIRLLSTIKTQKKLRIGDP